MNAHVQDWWRPAVAARDTGARSAAVRAMPATERSGRLGFRALVLFTVILVVAPQEFVAALKPLRIAFLAAVVAIGCYLYDRWNGRAAAQRTSVEVWIVLMLVAWAVATVPMSIWPGGSIGKLTDLYLKSVAVFILLAGVVDTPARLRTIAWTLSICTVPVAAAALLHYATGVYMPNAPGRIAGYGTSGLAGNPNDLALLLNLVMPLTAMLVADSERRLAKLTALGVLGLGGAAIVVTFSRSGFLTLATIGALYLWRMLRRGRAGLALAIVAVVIVGVLLAPSGYSDRLSTVVNINSDPTQSAQDRWRDMRAATEYFLSHPLVGAGIGMDILALNDLRGAAWLPVHDAYLNYAVDLGAPGLLLFVALLWCCIASAARVERRHSRGGVEDELGRFAAAIRISLIAFTVSAVFYPVAYHAYFYYFAGLAVATRRLDVTGMRSLEPGLAAATAR